MPWGLYQAVRMLEMDLRLGRCMELDQGARYGPQGAVWMRMTPEGGEWHGLVGREDDRVARGWSAQCWSAARGILVCITSAPGRFTEGMRAQGAAIVQVGRLTDDSLSPSVWAAGQQSKFSSAHNECAVQGGAAGTGPFTPTPPPP